MTCFLHECFMHFTRLLHAFYTIASCILHDCFMQGQPQAQQSALPHQPRLTAIHEMNFCERWEYSIKNRNRVKNDCESSRFVITLNI
jgi:hypothetical protein